MTDEEREAISNCLGVIDQTPLPPIKNPVIKVSCRNAAIAGTGSVTHDDLVAKGLMRCVNSEFGFKTYQVTDAGITAAGLDGLVRRVDRIK